MAVSPLTNSARSSVIPSLSKSDCETSGEEDGEGNAAAAAAAAAAEEEEMEM